MSEFSYAPGKPGIGTKGDKGENGVQGFSMYFTDLDPISQEIIINSKLENNQVLWSNRPNEYLPYNKEYITGDIFIDTFGNVYEIDSSTNTFKYSFASLNVGSFFIPLNVSTNEGYNRYFNSNDRQKYLIDNVYTNNGPVVYTEQPTNIYNIPAEEFTRIEYTNVNVNEKYPFTLYTIGEDENKAMAIIYDKNENCFRIGNINNDIIRNLSIGFDVSSLNINKNEQNKLNASSPTGSILTNYEINANSLFSPNFNREPSSFYYELDSTQCTIYWNLEDFTNDLNIKAELHFYKDIATYSGQTYSINSLIVRPMVFSELTNSGSVIINGLEENTAYKAFIKIIKNGWVRNSKELEIFPGSLDTTPNIFNFNTSSHLDASIRILANASWNYYFVNNPGNFVYNLYSPSEGPSSFHGSIYFDVLDNDGPERVATLRITPRGGQFKDVSIFQSSDWVTVPVGITSDSPLEYSDYVFHGYSYAESFKNHTVNIPLLPIDTVVDVSIKFKSSVSNYNIVSGESCNIDSSLAILAIGKSPNYFTWTDTCFSGSTKSNTSWASMQNIQIGNNPLNIQLYTKVGAFRMVYGDQMSSSASFEQLNFIYKSGTKVLFTYTINFGNTSAHIEGEDTGGIV